MKRLITAGLIGMLVLCGCTTNMTPYEAGNGGSARRVIVAGEDSAFKRKVLTRVIEKLGTSDWYYRITGLDTLAQEDSGQYGAVLTLVGIRGGKLDERLLRYLAKDPEDPRVVVFYTVGMEGPIPDSVKSGIRVDAVSSASLEDRVEMRAEQLTALLRERF